MSTDAKKSQHRQDLESLAIEGTNALVFRAITGIDPGVGRMSQGEATLWSNATTQTLVSGTIPEPPEMSDAEVARDRLRTAGIFDNEEAQLEAGRFFPEFREANDAWDKEYERDGHVSVETQDRFTKARDAVVDGTAFSTEVTGEQAGPPTREPTARPKDEVREKVESIVSRLPTEEPPKEPPVSAQAVGEPAPRQEPPASQPPPEPSSREPRHVDDRYSTDAATKNRSRREAMLKLQGKQEEASSGFSQTGEESSKDRNPAKNRTTEGSALPLLDQPARNEELVSQPPKPQVGSDFGDAVVDLAKETRDAFSDSIDAIRSVSAEIRAMKWTLMEATT